VIEDALYPEHPGVVDAIARTVSEDDNRAWSSSGLVQPANEVEIDLPVHAYEQNVGLQ
jgi:hypothetical protein